MFNNAELTSPSWLSRCHPHTLNLVQELKAAKAKYRTEFDRLKELRSDLEPSIISVAEAKQTLIDEFNKWAGSPLGTFTLAQPAVSVRAGGCLRGNLILAVER